LVRSTLVQRLRLLALVLSTSSTRSVFGHQRGRLWGSATRDQTSDGDASTTRRRLTLATAQARG
jgi:hypothetical protein